MPLPSAAFGVLLSFTAFADALTPDLLRRAAVVRRKIALPPPFPHDDGALSYPSAYQKPDGSGMRGYCNWIIPDRLMVGQYPGRTPESWGPTAEQAEDHVRSVVRDAGVTVFCCLQSEVPAQDDDETWDASGGEVYLTYPARVQFPRSFTRYAPAVRSELSGGDDAAEPVVDPEFWHAPIADLTVPNSEPLLELLSRLLGAMEEDRAVYLHCWGGRGRAGLVGACLTSLIWPEMDGWAVLDLVQAGYASRAGADDMPSALRRSPQTEEQRSFVVQFVDERRQRHGTF